MRRRFFVDEVRNGQAHIEGDDAKHLTKVLRVEVGQRFEISDNRNVYLAEVSIAHKGEVEFRTLEKLPAEPERVRITLCAALIKFDHFEWMIEKATELGVSEIVPVIATRTERGLDRAAEKRVERWRRIVMEASQQSRRSFLPEVVDAVSFAGGLARVAGHRYVLDEVPDGLDLLSALPAQRTSADSVALLVGPEGGWTDAERAAFIAAQWKRVTMGPLILRAETAAMASLSIVNAAWLVH
ncbi:MAG: RsmE family RNA methyltransferase [Bryobacteraceae bacterium]